LEDIVFFKVSGEGALGRCCHFLVFLDLAHGGGGVLVGVKNSTTIVLLESVTLEKRPTD
jgi:hypothetical protein